MTVELLMWFILLMIAVAYILAVIWFLWTLTEKSKDNEVARERELTSYGYDGNGNPIDFYDARTGRHFVRSVGNSRWPEPAQHFVVGNSPVAPIQREKQELPLTVYVGGKPKVEAVPPTFTDGPPVRELEPGTSVQGENVPNERDFITELSILKGEKVGKERAIHQVCNVRKGGSEAWKYWSSIFDQL